MPLNLAPEWLALEETLGFRPLVTGNTIEQIRENISNMTKNAPLPKDKPGLNIGRSLHTTAEPPIDRTEKLTR
ncbi:hypothetical protein FOPE_09184 [Fonsecaea pedrosoi]|nr:hypothetical protein FOPE_09184 [Fonsecaea pedrosoi]